MYETILSEVKGLIPLILCHLLIVCKRHKISLCIKFYMRCPVNYEMTQNLPMYLNQVLKITLRVTLGLKLSLESLYTFSQTSSLHDLDPPSSYCENYSS